MEFALRLAAPILASVAIGFALNRLVLSRISGGQTRAFALAASRAIFYAPSIEHLGHGIHLPMPLPLVLAYSHLEFGPELGLLTFLLPAVVFVGSIAVAVSKRFGLWFSGLITVHLILFAVLPFALPSFDARLALFAVNAMPWYPLHYFFMLPVTEYGWLTVPNEFGWMWAFLVWLVLYALLAIAATAKSRGRPNPST